MESQYLRLASSEPIGEWHDAAWIDEILGEIASEGRGQIVFVTGNCVETLAQLRLRARDTGWLVRPKSPRSYHDSTGMIGEVENLIAGAVSAIGHPVGSLAIYAASLAVRLLVALQQRKVEPADWFALLDYAKELSARLGMRGVVLVARGDDDERLWTEILSTATKRHGHLNNSKILLAIGLPEAPRRAADVDESFPSLYQSARRLVEQEEAAWHYVPSLTVQDVESLGISLDVAQGVITLSGGDDTLATRLVRSWWDAGRPASVELITQAIASVSTGLQINLRRRRSILPPNLDETYLLHLAAHFDNEFPGELICDLASHDSGVGSEVFGDFLDDLTDDDESAAGAPPLIGVVGHDNLGERIIWRFRYLDNLLRNHIRESYQRSESSDRIRELLDKIEVFYPIGGPLDGEVATLWRRLGEPRRAARVEARSERSQRLSKAASLLAFYCFVAEQAWAGKETFDQLLQLARDMRSAAQVQDAYKAARAALALGERIHLSGHNLGHVWFEIGACEWEISGQPIGAGRFDDAGRMILGGEVSGQDAYAKAFTYFTKAAENEPMAHLRNDLGLTLGAIAQTLTPDLAIPVFARARREFHWLRMHGDFRQQALSMLPRLWKAIGSSYDDLGDLSRAARRYRLSIEMAERNLRGLDRSNFLLHTYPNLASALRQVGDLAEADLAAEAAMVEIEKWPTDSERLLSISLAHHERGNLRQQRMNPNGAVKAFEQARIYAADALKRGRSVTALRQLIASTGALGINLYVLGTRSTVGRTDCFVRADRMLSDALSRVDAMPSADLNADDLEKRALCLSVLNLVRKELG